ncbi:MAG TPA: hypothetical protein PKE29_11100 [Phycisphaerales bacterium]|nr:hypothetical protein [Phycisphaerales bacterium]
MNPNCKPTAAKNRFAAVVVFSAAAGLGLTGASCERSAPTPAPTAVKRPADKVYTARGRITMLPAKEHPTRELVIKHEAINDFINPGGRMGMSAMEMPLTPDRSLPLGEFAVGDVVEFDLSVWYAPEFASLESYLVTRMRKLPEGTVLTFGPAAPVPRATP